MNSTCIAALEATKYLRLQQTSGRIQEKGMMYTQKSWTLSYRCPIDLHNYVRNEKSVFESKISS